MKHFALATLIAICSAVSAQSPIGNWTGELVLGDNTLTIHFNLFEDGKQVAATMDSPDQGAFGINADTASATDTSIYVRISKLAIQYRGKYFPDGDTISGVFQQGLYEFPLLLSRMDKLSKNRPQDPEPPFPYVSQNVNFPSWDSTFALAGTLTYPKGRGPFKAVVLVSGSGPQNRDEEIFNHRPFHVLADQLTRAGYVVFRYDDRGVEGSEGSFQGSTTMDFADDARAAVRLVRNIPFLKISEVGVIGHSEGGLIAGILGAKSIQDFTILLGTPTVPGLDIILRQNRDLLVQTGMSSKDIDAAVHRQEVVFNILVNQPDSAAKKRALAAEFRKRFGEMPLEEQKKYTSMNAYLDEQINPLLDPWLGYFLALDPAEYLPKIKHPVLYILGEKDIQVPADMNSELARKWFSTSPNEISIAPGLNHLMQPCKSCTVYEYSEIDTTFSPEVMQKIIDWLNGL